jgi:reverse gyrase
MATIPRLCERCGGEIPAERVEALPDTHVCVECSRKIGGEYILRAVPENLAKSGSLKKNYASWGVRKTRRPIRRETD